MRKDDWILTPYETAILVGATTLMVGSLVMVSFG
jgi:hypothetical protein